MNDEMKINLVVSEQLLTSICDALQVYRNFQKYLKVDNYAGEILIDCFIEQVNEAMDSKDDVPFESDSLIIDLVNGA